MKIAAIKDDRVYIGSIPAIAKKLNRNPETLRRWKREGKDMVFDSEHEIYLNVTFL